MGLIAPCQADISILESTFKTWTPTVDRELMETIAWLGAPANEKLRVRGLQLNGAALVTISQLWGALISAEARESSRFFLTWPVASLILISLAVSYDRERQVASEDGWAPRITPTLVLLTVVQLGAIVWLAAWS